MTTEIELEFNRQHFEEIYFKDYQGNYAFSQTTKPAFKALSVSAAILVSAFIYSWIYTSDYFVIIASIIFLLLTANYVNACWVLYKWKSQVKRYLDKEEKYKEFKIIISQNAFTIVQDGKETIECWSNFSSVQLSEECISLQGKDNFLIPSKSVSKEDYQTLRTMISEKVK